MIAGDRKKIIKMTQGERLFNVILVISVSWQVVVKSFQVVKNDGTGLKMAKLGKSGKFVFYCSRCSDTVPTLFWVSEHLKPRWTLGFLYTVPYVLLYYIKEYIRDYRINRIQYTGHILYSIKNHFITTYIGKMMEHGTTIGTPRDKPLCLRWLACSDTFLS